MLVYDACFVVFGGTTTNRRTTKERTYIELIRDMYRTKRKDIQQT